MESNKKATLLGAKRLPALVAHGLSGLMGAMPRPMKGMVAFAELGRLRLEEACGTWPERRMRQANAK